VMSGRRDIVESIESPEEVRGTRLCFIYQPDIC